LRWTLNKIAITAKVITAANIIFKLSVIKYPKSDATITNLLIAFNFSTLGIFSEGHMLPIYFLLNKIVGSFNQNGIDGVDGVDGIDGIDGIDCVDGIDSFDGVDDDSIDGIDDIDGFAGVDGIGGVDGIDGIFSIIYIYS
jgi:hypothetical protein